MTESQHPARRSARAERVFVDLDAVYSNADQGGDEMSFEELRAKARGWFQKDSSLPLKKRLDQEQLFSTLLPNDSVSDQLGCSALPNDPSKHQETSNETNLDLETTIAMNINSEHTSRLRKVKIKEIKAETQTGMTISYCHMHIVVRLMLHSQNKPGVSNGATVETKT